jgi:aminoglycoside/choline kinase family phosphotransferase
MTDPRMEAVALAAVELARRAGLGELTCAGTLAPVAEGGSDRRFYRLAGPHRSAVVLSQPGGGWEVDSYVEIARLLARFPVGAPEIFGVDRSAGVILMEDLGDLHLEDALRSASSAQAAAWYDRAVDVLVELQTSVTGEMAREGILRERIFGLETLLGETDYFRREFIGGYCPVQLPASWEEERRRLASTLVREPLVFMHRDFQSRNIMVKDGRLRIVDFQTAHRGPGLYDAASLLRDSYHPLSAEERRRLVGELHAKLEERGARRGEGLAAFEETFTIAGIQRTMQALAAFAKLGARMGKTRFLDSIPSAVEQLQDGLRESGRFPGLERMASAVRSRLAGTTPRRP